MNNIGHSGLCIICGKPIEIVPMLWNCEIPDIFLCPECEKKESNRKGKEDGT